MCTLQYVSLGSLTLTQNSLIHSDLLVTAVTHNHSSNPINMFQMFQNIWTVSAASLRHIIVSDSAVRVTDEHCLSSDAILFIKYYLMLHLPHPPDHYFCQLPLSSSAGTSSAGCRSCHLSVIKISLSHGGLYTVFDSLMFAMSSRHLAAMLGYMRYHV